MTQKYYKYTSAKKATFYVKFQVIFLHAKILTKAQKLKNSTPLKIVVLNNSISPKHQQAVAKVSKYGVTRLAKTFQKLT